MTEHIPVLLNETIDWLKLTKGDVVVDGTINTAGHSLEICKHIGSTGHLIGIDEDKDALAFAKKNLKNVTPKHTLLHGNYRDMDTLLTRIGITKVDKILLDIGLSNRQLFDSGRGFSFAKNEPLLMTFNSNPHKDKLTAEEIVNCWDEENIADIIYGYGDERFARVIARNIIQARSTKKISTTFELVEIIEKSVPSRAKNKRLHSATKTFQALRITVNDELQALKEGIDKGINLLNPNGRMVIISFHSGEDRIIKNMFREKQKEKIVEILTKKPTTPSIEEVKTNPKARSAKLRAIKKNN
ncbi:16S rRNA (cytosine(1402)-N(4))-methyltransferase RsmH [Patescibacteria group bacterium]|nr:16S rRNA (cytosine(1402)-N(4))-methyltransferase RsmH [Patescibacteria group bacterium]MBU1730086.1 16S rRNA (cytosine(1402)-N(4))-methyltransferase RsmH [Patescibacteria group bacterium]MBU1956727.1 16S rRNA (cytosine(1402)-N(4))-methyltransferase RsmH [Patescibacteria group bacterium]MBU2010416.1 16S rRNA (cytosine(1402)-N(4))-methyltransferase RsmH [Patescibacteria group bacterium]MBU2416411.1 16S rRNA (cytosine(1402)-N(4))-methyltransferase RsmH [Patescibacteria group bacterium]